MVIKELLLVVGKNYVLPEVGKAVGREVGKYTAEGVKGTVDYVKEHGIKETAMKGVELVKAPGEVVVRKLHEIKNTSPEQLSEKTEKNLAQQDVKERATVSELDETREGLTEEQKVKIKEETGWSDEIIDAIGSWEEYEIYKNAGLIEAEIGDRKCLIRDDIDWKQKDDMGRTNEERAKQGLSPINKEGKVIELHHIGQHADSPLAELTPEEHRGRGNDTVLHDKTKVSEIDRQVFAEERSAHWETRANEGGNR